MVGVWNGYGSEVSVGLRRLGALCRTDIRYTDGRVSLVLVLMYCSPRLRCGGCFVWRWGFGRRVGDGL